MPQVYLQVSFTQYLWVSYLRVMWADNANMDKFDRRRELLDLLIETNFEGHIASFAEAVGLAPSYVSRLLYPQDKPGMKRIGEGTIEKIEAALGIPGHFSTPAHPAGGAAFKVREPPQPFMTGLESELLRCYRLADRKGKDALLAAARVLAGH